MFRLWCLLVTAVTLVAKPQPVLDESVRIQVLGAAFPRAIISLVEGPSIDTSWTPSDQRADLHFADAFSKEKVYSVTGPVSNQDELCASENLADQSFSTTRELRFQVFRWPGSQAATSDFLLVAQYGFADAQPALACTSIGRLFHVARDSSGWHLLADFLLDTSHHSGLQSVQLIDLSGDGREELLVESDEGGPCHVGSVLTIFELSQGGFRQWLDTGAQIYSCIDKEEEYKQTLDVARAIREQGRQFCFTKTSYAENDKWFAKPRISYACYPRK